MSNHIVLPSKPRVISEDGYAGTYEIDGFYPGYGHTVGNLIRRIILSSLPGAAITSIKIEGIPHEFSTIEGVKEDVVTIILNLKRVRLAMTTGEPQLLELNVKGPMAVTAGDFTCPGQVKILNTDQHILTITGKDTKLSIEVHVERGLGYVPKELLYREKVEIGTIALDAIFTPIRRVNYEVENMRVGNRTDFNRLKIFIETDGTITPREALEQAISTTIEQLKAIVGFREEVEVPAAKEEPPTPEPEKEKREIDQEFLKTRIESLDLSPRIVTALISANIRTVGGLVRKKEEDILDIEGLGTRGVQEIKRMLGNYGITLK